MKIGSFKSKNREFSVWFDHNEFGLSLKPDYNKLSQSENQADRLFWDDEIFEEGDDHFNIFDVKRKVLAIMVPFIYKKNLPYFFFTSTTAKKIKTYERFSEEFTKLVPYDVQMNGGYFLFNRRLEDSHE